MQTIVYQCDTAMPAQKLPNCCKWYGVKNYEINFCRWIGVNDEEFWGEFSDSVVQMLCKLSKRKLQLTDNQLTAISLCCLGRIRTLTGGTRIRRATITPQGNFYCFIIRSGVVSFWRCKGRGNIWTVQIFSKFFFKKVKKFQFGTKSSILKLQSQSNAQI